MNKKTALGAAVALAVVAYGGATWYLGQRAQASYQEALEEVRKVLGAETVVSQDYQKGFFTSQAKVVLQWTPPASADAGEPAPQPLRVVVNSAVRHGPLAGGTLAAAVVESRFALEGLDAKAGTLLAKAQAPTLTTVHGLTGSHNMKLIVPAGELGDEEVTMRWQEMKTEFSVSGDRTQVKGNFQWPELAFSGVKKASDEEEAQDEAPSRFAMSLKGMNGDFESQIIDDLWMMAPGKGTIRFAQIDASNTPQGGTASTLLALNRLWHLGLPLTRLEQLGLQLGADVPFFVGGQNAFVEGIGEILTPIELPAGRWAVLKPAAALPTPKIFSSELLTRDTKPVKVAGLLAELQRQRETRQTAEKSEETFWGRNDLQAAAEALCPDVQQAARLLAERFGNSRMTGSGSAVFADAGGDDASETGTGNSPVATTLEGPWPDGWVGRMCRGLSKHPLGDWVN